MFSSDIRPRYKLIPSKARSESLQMCWDDQTAFCHRFPVPVGRKWLSELSREGGEPVYCNDPVSPSLVLPW